jgi:hypothetical protein
MGELLGMDPERVHELAVRLQSQLSTLDGAASTVDYAAAVSLNPLSYGVQPGGLLLAPFAVGGTQAAAARIRTATNSARELAESLFREVEQQRLASTGAGRAYRDPHSIRRHELRRPRAPGFWEGLIGGATGRWTESFVGVTDLLVGTAGMITDGLEQAGSVSRFSKGFAGFFKGASSTLKVAGGVFSFFGVVTGAYETTAGLVEGDGYRAVDGLIGIGVGAAGLVAAVGLASNPVGWVIAGVGLAWGVAQMMSGDVPVSRRIADGARSAASWGGAALAGAAKGVGDFVGGVTRSVSSWLR